MILPMFRRGLIYCFKQFLGASQLQMLFTIRFRAMRKSRVEIYLDMIKERNVDLLSLPNKIVIDLGANVGYFTEACSRMGSIVVAVEPNEFCFRELNRIKRKNNFEYLQILPVAIASSCGLTTFITAVSYPKDDPYGITVQATTNSDKSFLQPTFSQIVPKISFGNLLEQYTTIYILKVDIEGAEQDIIDEIISNAHKIEYLFFEAHSGKVKNIYYDAKIEQLYRFIQMNKLERKWLVDW